VNQVMSS